MRRPVEVYEHAGVDTKVLAGLERVRDAVEPVGGHGKEDLVDNVVALKQLGQVLEGADDGLAPHRKGRLFGVQADATANYPPRLGIASKGLDHAGGATVCSHHERPVHPPIGSPRTQPGPDETALCPDASPADNGEEQEQAPVDLALKLDEEQDGGQEEQTKRAHADRQARPRARRPGEPVTAEESDPPQPDGHDQGEEPEIVPEGPGLSTYGGVKPDP